MKQKLLFLTMLLAAAVVPPALRGQSIAKDTITILSFNDFHGNLLADTDEKVPGAAVFFEGIARERDRNPNAIVVSAGDNFWGTYFTHVTRGKPLDEIYDGLVAASAVGNHEFDWGLRFMSDTASRWVDFVAANIFYRGTTEIPQWVRPYKIVEKELKSGRKFKVAFVGVSTAETPAKSSGNLETLVFDTTFVMLRKTIDELKKEQRADMVVLLTHLGSETDSVGNVLFQENYARQLPRFEQVDAVITGHSHHKVFGEVDGVPVIQAKYNGQYIGKLTFGIGGDGKAVFLPAASGVIPVAVSGGDQDEEIGESVEQIIKENRLDRYISFSKDRLIHSRSFMERFTEVGAYIADAYAEFYRNKMEPADDAVVIGMNHFKGIRAGLPKDSVVLYHAGNVLPFDYNVLTAIACTGKDVKAILQAGITVADGYMQSANLKIVADDRGNILKMFYTKDKTTEVTDQTPCVIVLDDFVTKKDVDGYHKSLFDVGKTVSEFSRGKYNTTDVFVDYLEQKDFISAEDAPRVVLVWE